MYESLPVFVAETDETGAGIWVWYVQPGRALPRPVKEPLAHLPEVAQAAFYGADRAKISEWLQGAVDKGVSV